MFAANDQMALGLMRAFREAGLAMPGQVAVGGFDDIPEAEYFAPPLTTVRQDFAAVGQASIRMLLSSLTSSTQMPGSEGVVIEPRLIIRGSTSIASP